MTEIQDEEFKNRELVDLYARVYAWLVQEGIFSLKQLKEEGVSPYAGFACNQFISGMFIRKDGRVQACPGNETGQFWYSKDVRAKDRSFKDIWTESLGYELRTELATTGKMTLTQPCYAKTEGQRIPKGSIPADFYDRVLEMVPNFVVKGVKTPEDFTKTQPLRLPPADRRPQKRDRRSEELPGGALRA